MKAMRLFTFILLIGCSLSIYAQDINQIRFIEVKGMAEMEVQPDELVLAIGIAEYWEEEFEKNKKPEDYKTKVSLAVIEDNLIKNIRKVGIEKRDIWATGVGNYWRQQGKEFLFSKQLNIKITEFSKVNNLVGLIDARGIKYMNIVKFNNSDIDKYEMQVKKNALQNAYDKAKYMVNSMNEELGEVISITEVDNGRINNPYLAKGRMMTAGEGLDVIDQIKNINISSRVIVRFKIR